MPQPEELLYLPSFAQMGVLGVRAEALRGIVQATQEAHIAAAWDWVLARVGKRAKRPILAIDAELQRIVCVRASVTLIDWQRGRKPEAGQDVLIAQAMAEIREYLDEVKTGTIEPVWIDATPQLDEQGPYGGGDATADAFYRRKRCGCSGGCGQCYGLPGGH